MSEAIILHREPVGEFDFSVALFTKRYGKVVAKARSARKITSKLSGHLLPGKLADIRLVEQRGLQVVDALSTRTLPLTRHDLYMLHRILSEWERDQDLWGMLQDGRFNWLETLQLLGWAGEQNYCVQCGTAKADMFYGKTQELFCRNCAATFIAREKENFLVPLEVAIA